VATVQAMQHRAMTDSKRGNWPHALLGMTMTAVTRPSDMRDYIESKLFHLQIWCDQLGAEAEIALVVVFFVAALAAITWIYFV